MVGLSDVVDVTLVGARTDGLGLRYANRRLVVSTGIGVVVVVEVIHWVDLVVDGIQGVTLVECHNVTGVLKTKGFDFGPVYRGLCVVNDGRRVVVVVVVVVDVVEGICRAEGILVVIEFIS